MNLSAVVFSHIVNGITRPSTHQQHVAQTRDQDAFRSASTEPVLEDALVIRGTGRRWMEGDPLVT